MLSNLIQLFELATAVLLFLCVLRMFKQEEKPKDDGFESFGDE